MRVEWSPSCQRRSVTSSREPSPSTSGWSVRTIDSAWLPAAREEAGMRTARRFAVISSHSAATGAPSQLQNRALGSPTPSSRVIRSGSVGGVVT